MKLTNTLQIVEKDSAIIACWNEKVMLMHGDHSSMIKFSLSDDNEYTKVKGALARIVKERILKGTPHSNGKRTSP